MTKVVGEVALDVTANVTSLQVNLAKGAKATADFGAKAGRLGGAMTALQGNARGLAQQFNQVAQQTAATGNFMQALAVQLPDMAGMFGAVGAAVGVVAGLALPAMISALSATEDKTKAASEAVDRLQQATSNYLAAAKEAAAPTSDLAEQYGAMAAQASAALDAQRAVEFANALSAVDVAAKSILASIAVIGESFGTGASVRQVAELADETGLAEEQVRRLNAALQQLNDARGLDAQVAAAGRLSDELLRAYGSVDRMPEPIRQAYGMLGQMTTEAAKVATEALNTANALSAARDAASQLAGVGQGLVATFTSVAERAASVAASMFEAAKAQGAMQAAANMALQDNVLPGPAGAPASATAVPGLAPVTSIRPQQPGMDFTFGGASGGGGGGGGGGGSDAEARLQELRDRLASEAEIEMAAYEQQLADLQEFRDRKLLTEQEYNELERQATIEHQQAMSDIQTKALNERLGAYSGALGDLAGLMDTGNKRMFKIGKAAAIAQAVVDGYQAATAAWKHGMAIGGPGVAAGFAAASLAKTGALISSLRSTQIGGSSGGGGGGGGGGRGGASAGGGIGGIANITLVGETFSRDSVEGLFKQINDGLKQGRVINWSRA